MGGCHLTAPRLFLAYSGHSSSTYDVASYLHKALVRQGAEVRPFPLHTELVFNEMAIAEFYKRYRDGKEPAMRDVQYLAGRAMLGEMLAYKPDVLMVVSGLVLPLPVWEMLAATRRRLRDPWRVVVILTESPYRPNEELHLACHYADLVFSNEREFVKELSALRVWAEYLPHAYDPQVHFPAPDGRELSWDVYLCGSGFNERTRLLEQVNWSGIRFALRGIWPDAPQGVLAPFYQEGVVPNDAVAEEYRHSAIVLNVHRSRGERVVLLSYSRDTVVEEREPFAVASAYSTNARVIEAAACGAVVATDRRGEVEELLGDAALYYEDAQGLETAVRDLLAHPDRREALGRRAAQAVQGRTYDRHAQSILNLIGRLLL